LFVYFAIIYPQFTRNIHICFNGQPNWKLKVIQSVEESRFNAIYDDDYEQFDYRKIRIDAFNYSTLIYGKGEKNIKNINKIPIWLGIFIYSYARTHLYKAFRYGGLYSDTDSVIMRVNDFNNFAKENCELLAQGTDFNELNKCGNLLEIPEKFEYKKDAKPLGSYEIEAYIPHGKCYIIGKKIYGLFVDENASGFIGDYKKKSKFRLKGLSADNSTYNGTKTTFSQNPLKYFEAKIANPDEKVVFNTMQFIRTIASRGHGDLRTVLDIVQLNTVKAL